MTVDAVHFRAASSRFATGVTVVTTLAGGAHRGMTANSFTSVSLEPLLVLVSIDRAARFHQAIVDGGVFGVSILADGQRALAEWFANRARPAGDEQFAGFPHHVGAKTGVLLFDDSLATLECVTYSVHEAGDHSLVVGEVVALDLPRPDGDPLLFFRSGYRSVR